MAIEVADVVAQFGAYYIAKPENMKRLRSMLYQPGETAKYFQDRTGEDTRYEGTLSQLNRIVQPFQKAFTPIGTIKFTPNVFNLFKIKIDMSETPDDLEATYLGFLASQPEHDRANWLFIRWLIEVHIMAKIEEDLELNEYFAGEYLAPTPNVAGAAGTAMDGLRKIIRGYNTAGRTNLQNGPLALGEIPADDADFCTYMEELTELVPSLFRPKIDGWFMSHELRTKYRRGKRKKYGKEVNFVSSQELDTIEDHQNVKIIGLQSMSAVNSDMIWTSIPQNRIRPTKKAALKNSMKIESAKRVVDLLSDWWEVLNFEVPEFVFHNDQDLA